jgi:hypothetical protein
MEASFQMRASAVAATTATLVPLVGTNARGGTLADTVTQAVLTFTTARDTKFFGGVDDRFQVVISKL